jgi:cyclophilin family peptidyl-prolyl cis-trans isomerase
MNRNPFYPMVLGFGLFTLGAVGGDDAPGGAKIIEKQNPVVKLVTGKGDVTVELFEDKVPNTVANFIALAESGFYKGMRFHRIIPGFMAQGGCPHSKAGATGQPGTGGPGYRFADEFSADLKHDGPGILSMANSGRNTNGSQFFLCFVATPHLNGKHAVFGKVTAGLEVLKKLEAVGTPSGAPTEQVEFNVVVVSKQGHPYAVKKIE